MNDKRKKLLELLEREANWRLDQTEFMTAYFRKEEVCKLKRSVTEYLGYDVVCECIQESGYTRNYAIKLVEDGSFTDRIDDMFKKTKTYDRVMEEWLKAIEK